LPVRGPGQPRPVSIGIFYLFVLPGNIGSIPGSL
jgi:hypothetical protein